MAANLRRRSELQCLLCHVRENGSGLCWEATMPRDSLARPRLTASSGIAAMLVRARSACSAVVPNIIVHFLMNKYTISRSAVKNYFGVTSWGGAAMEALLLVWGRFCLLRVLVFDPRHRCVGRRPADRGDCENRHVLDFVLRDSGS